MSEKKPFYVTCPLSWIARVLPVLRASDRLAVAMLLYRQCRMRRTQTVELPNTELARLGIGRNTKYRALSQLQEAGAVTVETLDGRRAQVTLHWFP
jgi:DNA-binding transcriptional ArsR family regulator